MVRTHRNRVAILQTDHKELYEKMSTKLHELHALQSQINELKDKEKKESTKISTDSEMKVDA